MIELLGNFILIVTDHIHAAMKRVLKDHHCEDPRHHDHAVGRNLGIGKSHLPLAAL